MKTLKQHVVVAKNELRVAKNELKVAKNELKVAKNELEVGKSMESGKSSAPVCQTVFSALKSNEKGRLSDGTPARAETESHFSSLEPEVGRKRYQTRNKASVLWSTRKGKKASNAC